MAVIVTLLMEDQRRKGDKKVIKEEELKIREKTEENGKEYQLPYQWFCDSWHCFRQSVDIYVTLAIDHLLLKVLVYIWSLRNNNDEW